MDNQIKTSFIPRKPAAIGTDIRTAVNPGPQRSVGRTLFSLISTLIFLGTLAAYGGTFLWERQLNSTITQQQADMRRSLEGFDERFIKEATRLDTRIQEASKILVNHVSPSTLYALLSEHTLQTVSFSRFALQDLKDGVLKLIGTGEALRYESIVLQSDEFGRSGFLRNVLFTNLAQNLETQRVEFNFEAQLDPRLILYKDRATVLTSPTQ
jgi:hypothetical protein